jgi:hypothetical protein
VGIADVCAIPSVRRSLATLSFRHPLNRTCGILVFQQIETIVGPIAQLGTSFERDAQPLRCRLQHQRTTVRVAALP